MFRVARALRLTIEIAAIRPLGVEVPGGLYHVASWGDRREAV
jgi:hypothetical protein